MSESRNERSILKRIGSKIAALWNYLWSKLWIKFLIFGAVGGTVCVSLLLFLDNEGLRLFREDEFFVGELNRAEALRNAVWAFSTLGGVFAAFLLFANSVHRTEQKDKEILLKKQELGNAAKKTRAEEKDRAQERRINQERTKFEIFSRSLDQLTSDSQTIRSGGLYSIEQLIVEEFRRPEPNLGFIRNLSETLCAYARSATQDDVPQCKEDVISILNILARSIPVKYRPSSGQGEINLVGIDVSDGDISSGSDFRGFSLRHSNFSGVYLREANFRNCFLSDIKFADAYLTECDFTDAWLYGADFARADLWESKFDGAEVNEVDFDSAEIHSDQIEGMKWYMETPPKNVSPSLQKLLDEMSKKMESIG